MQVTIRTIASKKLVGKRISMSLSNDKTGELFKGFMPRRKEIPGSIGTDVFCVRVYSASYNFNTFDPTAVFEKWAAIEVTGTAGAPQGMECFELQGGLYAVFFYKGLSTDTRIFEYIYGTWLPDSEYIPDNRPHFEVLGEKYKNNDPDSEEEIWIPVKPKT